MIENNIRIGDIVIFKGAAFCSGAITGYEQEGRIIGIKGNQCAIEQVYITGKTRLLRKPIKSRHVVIRSLSDVIKDRAKEVAEDE